VSTCLLAGGAGAFFNESSRMNWMVWGCFGLASAVCLDIVARARERTQIQSLNRIATNRFERELQCAAEENKTNAVIREAVYRLLEGASTTQCKNVSRRTSERRSCDIGVELLLHQDANGAEAKQGTCTRVGRLTNLSDLGFELTLADSVLPQRVTMNIAPSRSDRISMLGEVLWCSPQSDGSIIAGGRFLSVVSVEGDTYAAQGQVDMLVTSGEARYRALAETTRMADHANYSLA
jgi:hypothetical protein